MYNVLVNCKIDYLNRSEVNKMSESSENKNHYWNNGAFCENCGILTGNVINNGILPIYHKGCKPGCKSVWEDQDPMSDDEDEEEEEEEVFVYKSMREETGEFELWANKWGLINEWDEEEENQDGMQGRGEVDWEVLNKEPRDYIMEMSRRMRGEVDWEVLDKEPRDYIVKWSEMYHGYTE